MRRIGGGTVSRLCLVSALLLSTAALAYADSLTLKSAGAGTSGLTYDDVQIDRIEAGQIFFSINGDERNRSVAQIESMQLDSEPAFNAAETAYEHQQWSDAVDQYAQTLARTDKTWLKDWLSPRMFDAAQRAKRFDAAVTAWIQIAQSNPTTAVASKPAIPPPHDPSLDVAAGLLQDAANNVTGDGHQAILDLLLQVQSARRDTKALQAVAGSIVSSGTDDPAAIAVQIDAGLQTAQTQVSQRQYDAALATINTWASRIESPAQQAKALLLRGQALEGKAAADPSQPDLWKDAALTYLNLYVHFPSGSGSEQSPQALDRAADIEAQQLHEPQVAATLYGKIISEYKNAPQADEARQALAQLKSTHD